MIETINLRVIALKFSIWDYNESVPPHLNNSIGQGMQCRLSLKLFKE